MKKIKPLILILIGIYIILTIPFERKEAIIPAAGNPFIWNSDSLWDALEKDFSAALQKDCQLQVDQIHRSLSSIENRLSRIENSYYGPDNKIFDTLLSAVFNTAPIIGACPDSSYRFLSLVSKMREIIKNNSIEWNNEDLKVRGLLYRLIYGGRAAAEEIMLQADSDALSFQTFEHDSNSNTPFTNFMGVEIHSGDILVSRGGAPTSALIARGSDYPGNFSHVALVFIDPITNIPYIIESHIEIGVTVSTLQEYINDKKLRIMIIRVRNDLPQILNDPMIPHKAAKFLMDRAIAEHIPYDFEMDHQNEEKLFCSEVVSSAYRKYDINLWENESSISAAGTAELLSSFGVRNFETQEPSDLEFDPKVIVIAEWRDLETLFQDHVDNAAVDAVIDWLNSGNEISGNFLILPVFRIVKLYSIILNQFDLVGPVPEGMSAEAAMIHEAYSSLHSKIKGHILKRALDFKAEYNYRAPYWVLVKFANEYFEEK